LGGRMQGPSLTSNFGGVRPPSPLSLRRCILIANVDYTGNFGRFRHIFRT